LPDPDKGGILHFSGSNWKDNMNYLQQTIKAVIRPGEKSGYVAECLEIAVVTQGRTLDETVKHLQEATALHLEGEDLTAFGLRQKPTLVLTMELDPAHAQAS
jgi:predicted RNase H-like HicB family nuclease